MAELIDSFAADLPPSVADLHVQCPGKPLVNLGRVSVVCAIAGNHDPAKRSYCAPPDEPRRSSIDDLARMTQHGPVRVFNVGTRGVTPSSKVRMVLQPTMFFVGALAVAIYGIDYTDSVALLAALKHKWLTFEPPPGGAFNILMIHQNVQAYHEGFEVVDKKKLPSWFHLFHWGHDHSSMPSVVDRVMQLGSTYATEPRPSQLSTRYGLIFGCD